MTRRDYELLSAAILSAARGIHVGPGCLARLDGVRLAARALALELSKRSSAFDPDRFMRDCGFIGESMTPPP